MNETIAIPGLPNACDSLSPELDRRLRAAGRSRRLLKNETLYSRGSVPDAIYCIEHGAIQLSTTSSNGRESVLGVVDPGRWFGELTLWIEEPRAHDAKAINNTQLLVVSAESMHAIVDHEPTHLQEILRLVCRRYKRAIERIEASVLQPLPVRLAYLLVAEAKAFTRDQAQHSRELKLSQESLGQMLGASRQSINRQLKQWESEGIVHVSYGRIKLIDPEFLTQMR